MQSCDCDYEYGYDSEYGNAPRKTVPVPAPVPDTHVPLDFRVVETESSDPGSHSDAGDRCHNCDCNCDYASPAQSTNRYNSRNKDASRRNLFYIVVVNRPLR
ncbi:hypothetical protein EYZ11_006853 [Aspergillus tanneri]|uniref:Uncharacterized protein n=1 Tax=Aspergillus tanneri TaxID=1220188 RepID=A0A4S3JGQ1_9EURO|nr:hypothetical protein EYZ11_006853 [Aspergillus tanneri]